MNLQPHFLNLYNPTDPANYVDRPFANGVPLHWQDDLSGIMQSAVMAYLNQTPTPTQLQIVIAYCQYYIHAPSWLDNQLFDDDIDPEIIAGIETLRAQSLTMATLADVNAFIAAALEIAIDPL